MLIPRRPRPTRGNERAKRAKALFRGRRTRPMRREGDRANDGRRQPPKATAVDVTLWFG